MPAPRNSAFSIRILLPVISIVLFQACSTAGDRSGEHYFEIVSENGAQMAVTSSVPKYDGQLFEFEEILRLQQDEDRPESLLNRARLFILGDDGNYYVPDFGDNRIAVFNGKGVYSHSIGRQGAGPGEFESVFTCEVKNGQLTAFDMRSRRLSIFSTNGEFIHQINAPQVGIGVNSLTPLSEDRTLISYTDYDPTDPEYMPQWTNILVFSASNDTLCQLSSDPWSFGKRIFVDRFGGTAQHFFGPRTGIYYYPGCGILKYNTKDPIIEWYNLYGSLQRTIRMDMSPEKVTDEEKKGIQRYLQRRIDEASNEGQRAVYEESKKQAVIPSEKSCWGGVSSDEHGYHWITYYTDYAHPDPLEAPLRYRLLSPEGEYLGDVEYPERGASRSRGHLLVYREDDETGEIAYIVYRMIPAVEGFKYP